MQTNQSQPKASAVTTTQVYKLETDGPIAGRGEQYTLSEWKRIYGHDLNSAYLDKKLLIPVGKYQRLLSIPVRRPACIASPAAPFTACRELCE